MPYYFYIRTDEDDDGFLISRPNPSSNIVNNKVSKNKGKGISLLNNKRYYIYY